MERAKGCLQRKVCICCFVERVVLIALWPGLQRDAQAALDYVLRDSQLSKLPIVRLTFTAFSAALSYLRHNP